MVPHDGNVRRPFRTEAIRSDTVENKQFTREDRALRTRKMRIPTYPKATMPLK